MDILENIHDTLGNAPNINDDTYTDTQKFRTYCERYRSIINQENKDMFLLLSKSEQEIENEMKKRQIQMLREIGIMRPSLRVQMIMDETRGIYFTGFVDSITWLKLARKGKTHLWPTKKKIEMPPKIIAFFEKQRTTILTAIDQNL